MRFASTRWSLVAAAGAPDDASARTALGDLCVLYWEPVFFYLRRKGFATEKAEDMTQGFVAHLLRRGRMSGPDRDRGRFRNYLLGALNHYVSNEEDKARAIKRGGGVAPLPLDFAGAEDRFLLQAAPPRTPEDEFARRWALTVLEETLASLKNRYSASGQDEVFQTLSPLISGEKGGEKYRALGKQLGMSEDAVKAAVSRMRKRYREELRRRIADTLVDPVEIEDELRGLIAALR